MNKVNFEKKYLGKKVKVQFRRCFLEPTQSWVEEEEEFVGVLAKEPYGKYRKNADYYFLEEHRYGRSKLWSTVFSIKWFKSIRLVEVVE